MYLIKNKEKLLKRITFLDRYHKSMLLYVFISIVFLIRIRLYMYIMICKKKKENNNNNRLLLYFAVIDMKTDYKNR